MDSKVQVKGHTGQATKFPRESTKFPRELHGQNQIKRTCCNQSPQKHGLVKELKVDRGKNHG